MKFNLKSIRLDNVATWLGAIALAGILFSIVYILAGVMTAGTADLSKVDLNSVSTNSLYEKPPANDEDQVPQFSENPDLSEKPVVADKKADNPASHANPYELWSYQGDSGPAQWAKLDAGFKTCGDGKMQSPINLHHAKESPEMIPLRFDLEALSGVLSNDQRNLSFKPSNSSKLLAFNTSYQLKQIDFHIPSEHRINNQKYDAEIQLIHVNQFGDTLVVGIFARETATTNPALAKLWAEVPKSKDRPVDLSSIDISSLLPKSRDYFRYEGSLTTPPCREKVIWTVLREPINVSAQQIDRFLAAVKYNARPLQKLEGRVISRSW